MPRLLFQSLGLFQYFSLHCYPLCCYIYVSIDLSAPEDSKKIMQDVKRCRQGYPSELGVLVARAAACAELIHHNDIFNAIFDILACRNYSSPKSIFVSST